MFDPDLGIGLYELTWDLTAPSGFPKCSTGFTCSSYTSNKVIVARSYIKQLALDFVSDQLGDGRRFRILTVVDDFTRECLALVADTSLSGLRVSRELDALRLVVQGLANKEIASRMEISESAVTNTLQQLFAKTGVRTRSQLVRTALENYKGQL